MSEFVMRHLSEQFGQCSLCDCYLRFVLGTSASNFQPHKKTRCDSGAVHLADSATGTHERAQAHSLEAGAKTRLQAGGLLPAHCLVLTGGSEYFACKLTRWRGDSDAKADALRADAVRMPGSRDSAARLPVFDVPLDCEADVEAALAAIQFMYTGELAAPLLPPEQQWHGSLGGGCKGDRAPELGVCELLRVRMVVGLLQVKGCAAACDAALLSLFAPHTRAAPAAAAAAPPPSWSDAAAVLAGCVEAPLPEPGEDGAPAVRRWQDLRSAAVSRLVSHFRDAVTCLNNRGRMAQLQSLPAPVLAELLRSDSFASDATESSVLLLLEAYRARRAAAAAAAAASQAAAAAEADGAAAEAAGCEDGGARCGAKRSRGGEEAGRFPVAAACAFPACVADLEQERALWTGALRPAHLCRFYRDVVLPAAEAAASTAATAAGGAAAPLLPPALGWREAALSRQLAAAEEAERAALLRSPALCERVSQAGLLHTERLWASWVVVGAGASSAVDPTGTFRWSVSAAALRTAYDAVAAAAAAKPHAAQHRCGGGVVQGSVRAAFELPDDEADAGPSTSSGAGSKRVDAEGVVLQGLLWGLRLDFSTDPRDAHRLMLTCEVPPPFDVLRLDGAVPMPSFLRLRLDRATGGAGGGAGTAQQAQATAGVVDCMLQTSAKSETGYVTLDGGCGEFLLAELPKSTPAGGAAAASAAAATGAARAGRAAAAAATDVLAAWRDYLLPGGCGGGGGGGGGSRCITGTLQLHFERQSARPPPSPSPPGSPVAGLAVQPPRRVRPLPVLHNWLERGEAPVARPPTAAAAALRERSPAPVRYGYGMRSRARKPARYLPRVALLSSESEDERSVSEGQDDASGGEGESESEGEGDALRRSPRVQQAPQPTEGPQPPGAPQPRTLAAPGLRPAAGSDAVSELHRQWQDHWAGRAQREERHHRLGSPLHWPVADSAPWPPLPLDPWQRPRSPPAPGPLCVNMAPSGPLSVSWAPQPQPQPQPQLRPAPAGTPPAAAPPSEPSAPQPRRVQQLSTASTQPAAAWQPFNAPLPPPPAAAAAAVPGPPSPPHLAQPTQLLSFLRPPQMLIPILPSATPGTWPPLVHVTQRSDGAAGEPHPIAVPPPGIGGVLPLPLRVLGGPLIPPPAQHLGATPGLVHTFVPFGAQAVTTPPPRGPLAAGPAAAAAAPQPPPAPVRPRGIVREEEGDLPSALGPGLSLNFTTMQSAHWDLLDLPGPLARPLPLLGSAELLQFGDSPEGRPASAGSTNPISISDDVE